jgi:hypothetical protein
MNAISTLTALPLTRESQKDYIKQVKTSLLNGYVEPFEAAKMLKSFEDIIKALRADSEINELISNEADNYTEKAIEVNGCKFTKCEKPTYDFMACEDSVWRELNIESVRINTLKKERETLLKSLKSEIVNPDTGEVIKPPTKKSTSYISVTLAK